MTSKAPFAECHKCPLFDKPIARTQGPADADVAFVARSPGYHESLQGKPFSGPSGKVLDHLLERNGIKRNEIITTNVVLCAPDAGKVPPEAIKACAPRLLNELKSCSLVIAAGSEAVNLLIGRGAIDRYRGYRINRNGTTLVATNNPALVLRDDSTFPNLIKDFQRAFNPIPQPPFPEVTVIEDKQDALDFLECIDLEGSSLDIACDLETRTDSNGRTTIVTMQFSTSGEEAIVLGERDGLFEDGRFIDVAGQMFETNDNIRWVWQGGAYDVKVLYRTYGIEARIDEDTMLMSYVLDERPGVHGLEYMLAEEFGWPDYTPDSVKRFKTTGEVEDYDALYKYAGWDAAGTYQLYRLFKPKLDERDEAVYRRLLLRGVAALKVLEIAGMPYNVEAAADLQELEIGPKLNELRREMQELVDDPIFNPASDPQKGRLFYDLWGVHHEMQTRPDKKRSIDKPARTEILENRFSFPELDKAKFDNRLKEPAARKKQLIMDFTEKLNDFQALRKQSSTYIIGMIPHAEKNGRIYTTLQLHTTVTGRPSSTEPNLLNITRTKEGLPDIRKLFVAGNGWKIVQADYSQAELRCIAQFSEDPELIDVYANNLDLHSRTATEFFGANFTPEQRSIAKNCNFGMFYEQSAATFKEKHGIDVEVAQRYIDWAHRAFPAVWAWEAEVKKLVHSGTVISPFGRKRRFYLITSENKNAAYREAINFYPQSTAADLTLLSLIQLVPEVDPSRARICLTVYDSIIGEVRDDYIDEYSAIVRAIMESCPKDELGWELPFKVDIGAGQSWAEAK